MCRYLLAFLPALFIHSGCGAEGTITGDGCLSGDDCAESTVCVGGMCSYPCGIDADCLDPFASCVSGTCENAAPTTCLAGWDCASRGSAACHVETLSADTIQITAQTGEGSCVMVKPVAAESDHHLPVKISDNVVWNGMSWANGGIYYAQGDTWNVSDRSLVWRPQAATARFRHSEVAAPEGQLGRSDSAPPYHAGWEYEAATDNSTGWESADNLSHHQIGTARSFGALSSGEYGVFARSNDNSSSITMQFQIVEESATLSFVDDGSGTPPGVVPANPNATLGARQLLQSIIDNTSAQPRKVGSGLHIGNWANASLTQVNELQTQTGQIPWLLGAEYDASANTPNYGRLNTILIDHYNSGGAVSISLHAYNPVTGGDYRDRNLDIEKLLAPGTQEYNKWRDKLDVYAQGLQVLEDAGVPVLFRPFHEMNATKFWWTYANTTMTVARYKELWRQTFVYLTDVKGLDNLLWVFSAHIKDRAGLGAATWYPGDDYVDVVGLSNYQGGTTTSTDRTRQLQLHLATSNKPFAITECCRNRSESDYDNSVFLDELRDNYTYVSYFMLWSGRFGPTQNSKASVLFNDPLIDNR